MFTRYIENKYNYIDINENEVIQIIKEKYHQLLKNQLVLFPPDEKNSINSKGIVGH